MARKGDAGGATRGPKRVPIAGHLQQKLLVECGYKCSIPQCPIREGLEFHHIHGNPSSSDERDLIVLCTAHHRTAHARGSKLTPALCARLRATIAELVCPLAVDVRELAELWRKVLASRSGSARRRELLELLAEKLLACVPGLIVEEKRAWRPTGEVHILVRNESAERVFARLGAQIVVECRARKREPVQKKEVADLVGKMALNEWRAGFLFSLPGFTRDAMSVARHVSGRQLVVVLLGPKEIGAMVGSGAVAEQIRQAVRRSVQGN
jgi:hypothetical protein